MLKRISAVGIATVGMVPVCHAATLITWSGQTSSDFEVGTNWVGGVKPVNSTGTDIAVFSGAVTTNQPQLTLTTARSINGLRFESAGWNLGRTVNASTLTVASGNITTTNTSGTNTISGNIQSGGGAPISWSVAGGGVLNVTGNVYFNYSATMTGGGTIILAGDNNTTNTANNGNISITAGTTLLVNGITANQGNYVLSATSLTVPQTLGGTGSIGLYTDKTVSLSSTSAANRPVLAPGDIATTSGTLTIGTTGNNNTVTLGNNSTFALDINGATADRLTVHGRLDTTGNNILALNVVSAPVLNRYVLASFDSIVMTGKLAENGGFTSVTGLPTGYHLEVTGTEIVLATIPEPSTLALLGTVVAGMLMRRRRV